MNKIGIIILCAAAAGFLTAACAPRRPISAAEFPARHVKVGETTYSYRVFLPTTNRIAGQKLPVMLYLHGSGSRGTDNEKPVEAFRDAIAAVKDKINFIIVIPQCRNETFWASTEMANYALAALDGTVREFDGDPNRLYLAGFSLGGYGTWQIAAANPGRFAALVPVAGGVVGERPIAPADRAVIIPHLGEMLDSPDPYGAVAAALGNTPVWMFHGAKDESVPVQYSRAIVEVLKSHGNNHFRYTEFADEGHMIFARSLAEPGLFEWLAEQKLK